MVSKEALTLAFAAALFAQAAQADIQHIVVVKYQANIGAGTKADIARRFLALKDVAKRDGQLIVSITGGRAISKEGFDQQLEQAFIVTFKNTTDRDYFVGKPYRNTMDPDHLALATIVEPLLHRDVDGKVTGLFVFDFNDRGRPIALGSTGRLLWQLATPDGDSRSRLSVPPGAKTIASSTSHLLFRGAAEAFLSPLRPSQWIL